VVLELLAQQSRILEELLALEKKKQKLLLNLPWGGEENLKDLGSILQRQEVLLKELDNFEFPLSSSGDAERLEALKKLAWEVRELNRKNGELLERLRRYGDLFLRAVTKKTGDLSLGVDHQV